MTHVWRLFFIKKKKRFDEIAQHMNYYVFFFFFFFHAGSVCVCLYAESVRWLHGDEAKTQIKSREKNEKKSVKRRNSNTTATAAHQMRNVFILITFSASNARREYQRPSDKCSCMFSLDFAWRAKNKNTSKWEKAKKSIFFFRGFSFFMPSWSGRAHVQRA